METVPFWDEVGGGANRCVFAMVISNSEILSDCVK